MGGWEEHDGPVGSGERAQRAVRELAQLVEVAHERKPPRGGRQAVGFVVSAAATEQQQMV